MEIERRPPANIEVPKEALIRILQTATNTLHENKAELGFYWSLTDKGSPLRAPEESVAIRAQKVRRMELYVAHLQKCIADMEAVEAQENLKEMEVEVASEDQNAVLSQQA